jgi:hypothetical protein
VKIADFRNFTSNLFLFEDFTKVLIKKKKKKKNMFRKLRNCAFILHDVFGAALISFLISSLGRSPKFPIQIWSQNEGRKEAEFFSALLLVFDILQFIFF